jgi:single-stranded-DNA-specific exonuclease
MAEPRLADWLDLVALGTVADVVPLDANNRILVRNGLERIRAGRCRPGIRALFEVAGRDPASAQATDLGFTLGPRLNAAGRLSDMSLGIECLLADDMERARTLAGELDRLNRERRDIEDDMKAQAEDLLAAWVQEPAPDLAGADANDSPLGLCLFHPEWHQGVIGILAARVKEARHRPVIAFAPQDPAQPHGILKGSARSIPGLHIRDALDEVAARHPGLISKFGGHAMAAGLSLPAAHFDAFRAAFDAVVRSHLAPADLDPVLLSDGEIPHPGLDLGLARALATGGPWGQAFPEPLFDGRFRVVSQRILKERHLKLVLSPEGSSRMIDAIAFNQAQDHAAGLPEWLHLAYRLDVNRYRGEESLQLRVEQMEPA